MKSVSILLRSGDGGLPSSSGSGADRAGSTVQSVFQASPCQGAPNGKLLWLQVLRPDCLDVWGCVTTGRDGSGFLFVFYCKSF